MIDLGANLPDSDALIQDDELIAKVFGGRPTAGLLFTHPHEEKGLYEPARPEDWEPWDVETARRSLFRNSR